MRAPRKAGAPLRTTVRSAGQKQQPTNYFGRFGQFSGDVCSPAPPLSEQEQPELIEQVRRHRSSLKALLFLIFSTIKFMFEGSDLGLNFVSPI